MDRKFAYVGISTESPENLKKMKDKSGVDFAFLSDAEGKLLDVFGIRHKGGNAMDGSDVARPTIVVLRNDGKLGIIEATTNYRVRPSGASINEKALQAIGQK